MGKKRGRPSLADVQKRSLRLQSHSPSNPNPRSIPTPTPRRHLRSNPSPSPSSSSEDLGSSANKRQKKLKRLHRLRPPSTPDPEKDGSKQNGGVADQRFEENGGKVMDAGSVVSYVHELFDLVLTGDPPESGPVTPLPEMNLLLLVLDRLQKKDTYGVYAEPVERGELPDYHDIIKDPMDFGTVRKKLASGVYVNLEQFEKDIFLISSNAMQYNAPDTIYFRQARSIHELATKDFESLRKGEDLETTSKAVRRGRPPSMNKVKQTAGRPSADRGNSDFSYNATDGNAGSDSHWSTSERNDEYSGSVVKGIPMKYGKKTSVTDDNRRDTYSEPQQGVFVREPSVFTTFDSERKLLVPVGLQMELAYARSLARFAAKLGPVGWEIAARQIERVISAGTAFGRGWVVDCPTTGQPQKPFSSTHPLHLSFQSKGLYSTTVVKDEQLPDRQETLETNSIIEDGAANVAVSPSAASAILPDHGESDHLPKGTSHEGRSNLPVENSNLNLKAPFQLHQSPAIPPTVNGFSTTSGFIPQAEKILRPVKSAASIGCEAALMTDGAPRGPSRSSNGYTHQGEIRQYIAEKLEPVADELNSASPLLDTFHDLPC